MRKQLNRKTPKAKNQKESIRQDKYQKILSALENPKYSYRTVTGLIKEARVSLEDVNEALLDHSDELVVLHRKGKRGQLLITTRKHYSETASIKEKIMGALLNRVY